MSKSIRNVCVYCASSQQAHPEFYTTAADLGEQLARAGIRITYGGGAVGLMGALADAALRRGGEVVGVLPSFMDELGWGHAGLTELHVVADMHTRKRRMIEDSDAVIAMPGGCGTLEELSEAITWKRLGLYHRPILLLNTRDFYRGLLDLLQHMVNEKFMQPEHLAMWTSIDRPDQAIAAIGEAPPWDESALEMAQW